MTGRRAAALAALVVVSVAGILSAREAAIGRSEATAADAAAMQSDWPGAIAHARAAAEAFVPGSPWPERGRLRLEAIAHDAEARGDDATALLAYGAMRAAAMATRAPGSGSARWRATAEEGLARVAAMRTDASGARPPRARGQTETEAERATLDALRDDDTPSTWTLALLGCTTAALLSIGFLASRRLML
jgi:hypothetical protein